MTPKLYILLFAGMSLLAISCKTASKMYEKGNYDQAVELAAKKLQKDPDDAKLIDIVRNSYRYAVNDHETDIRSHSESSNELKWEWMHANYTSLQKMYESIRKVSSISEIVNPTDYSSYISTYAQKAGEVRYERGLSFMQRYDKKSYQQAYREFQAALGFIPGDRGAITKMNEAYEFAVTNVVILPLHQQGGYLYSSYNVGGSNLDDQLIRSLQYSSGNEFVKFYSAWDARSQQVRTDQVVELQLSRVNIGRYQDYRSTRRVSKEVLIKETVYRPDSVVREYGYVYADITTTRRTIASHALLLVNVRDTDGRWLWNDQFNGTHNWNTDFATYSGDSRALSASDKQLIDQRPGYGPPENEIMRSLIDAISNDAVYRIKNYFNRY